MARSKASGGLQVVLRLPGARAPLQLDSFKLLAHNLPQLLLARIIDHLLSLSLPKLRLADPFRLPACREPLLGKHLFVRVYLELDLHRGLVSVLEAHLVSMLLLEALSLAHLAHAQWLHSCTTRDETIGAPCWQRVVARARTSSAELDGERRERPEEEWQAAESDEASVPERDGPSYDAGWRCRRRDRSGMLRRVSLYQSSEYHGAAATDRAEAAGRAETTGRTETAGGEAVCR